MSPLNILALVRRMCAPVSGALGVVGLAFAATPAPVAVAPGVYAPANLGRIGNVAFVVGPRGVVVPDLRDGDGKGWPEALAALKATKCIHLVPAFGRIGSCADINALARYFAALDGQVRTLLAAGVGLAELPARCDLPEFAAWTGTPRSTSRTQTVSI